MNKKEQHIVLGMNMDASPNQLKNTHVFEANNIRVTAMHGNSTLLSVTNEKGNDTLRSIGNVNILGYPIGVTTINNYAVIFTTRINPEVGESPDRIYRAEINPEESTYTAVLLFEGNLGFSLDKPLETLPFYENEDIQKVYWTDGVYQPRMINIMQYSGQANTNPDLYNFTREITGSHSIKVEKNDTGGEFSAGTVQYCYTLYNKFGQESAIVDASPLYYLSSKTKGVAAGQGTNCSFKVTIHTEDASYEYVRIYAIVRTSQNAEPAVRILGDYSIGTDDIIVYDTGTFGSSVDGDLLLFLNGEVFSAETMATKDNTLFLGNLKDLNSTLQDIKEYLEEHPAEKTVESVGFKGNPENTSGTEFYDYPVNNNRSSREVKSFKYGENYRLGFIAQDKRGRWSEAIWLGDYTEEKLPTRSRISAVPSGSPSLYDINTEKGYRNPGFRVNLGAIIVSKLKEKGYVRVAPVVVYPNDADRLVLCQGILSGTVFNVHDRVTGTPFVQADWRFRDGYSWREIPWEIQVCEESYWRGLLNTTPGEGYGPYVTRITKYGTEYIHKREYVRPEFPAAFTGAEGHGKIKQETFDNAYGNYYYRDPSIVTFHSPDIEFSDNIHEEDFENTKLRIVGISVHKYQSEDTSLHPITSARTVPAVSAYLSAGVGVSNSQIVLQYPQAKNYYTPWENTCNSVYANIGASPIRGIGERQVWELKNALSYPGYRDIAYGKFDSDNNNTFVISQYLFDWLVPIWHSTGPLSNSPVGTAKERSDGYKQTSLIKRQCISEFNYAVTIFADDNSKTKRVHIKYPSLYKSYSDTSLVKLHTEGDNTIYYGDIDKLISFNSRLLDSEYVGDKDYVYAAYNGDDNLYSDIFEVPYYKREGNGYPTTAIGVSDVRDKDIGGYMPYAGIANTPIAAWTLWNVFSSTAVSIAGKEPVRMKYKTTPHLVIPLLDSTEENIGHLGEEITMDEGFPSFSQLLFWHDSDTDVETKFVGLNTLIYHDSDHDVDVSLLTSKAIYVADLYRTFSQERMNSRFGGNSQEALAANTWTVCGNSVNLENGPAVLNFKEGDTYVSRYDCLKAYPYTQEDTSSIVSIYSTEIETRVNLDERYDGNRGLKDNTLITPVNFNLLNRAGYEQTPNFFTYHSLDYDRYKSLVYPNSIMWSLEKRPGEDVDTWTNISPMTQFDLDGVFGEITALTFYRNEIFAFQRRALSQIIFNARVQIPTSDNNPIEITNGYKVSGKRYISENIGTSNKWSVASTTSGLYFIDDEKASIYRLGDSLEDLSNAKGMKSWLINQQSIGDSADREDRSWTPRKWLDMTGAENIKTMYDKLYGDIYFVGENKALVFSGQLGEFTSFIDYGSYPWMFNTGNKFYSVLPKLDFDHSEVFEFWKGDHNKFFNIRQSDFRKYPMSLTYIANADPTYDKVFDNVEWQSEAWLHTEQGKRFLPMDTFDSIRVWNTYQDTYEVPLVNTLDKPSSLKKKFNVFRALIPRSQKTDFCAPRQRIRSPWAKIKLTKHFYDSGDEDVSMELRDVFFTYFM